MITGNLGAALALIWILSCTAVFFTLLRSKKVLPGHTLGLFGAALLVRLVPALILPNGTSYEMQVFGEAADIFRRGESIYLVRVAHPYLPLEIYWLVLARWLAENVGLYFVFWVKSLNIIADSLTALIIFVGISRFRAPEHAQKTGWLYVFNPITILVAAYQGQFDALPLLFVVLAWYFYEQSLVTNQSFGGAAWFTGMAILSKTWPFILAPILFLRLSNWRHRVQVTVLVALPVLLGILLFELLFPGSWQAMLQRAMRAGAISGWWGYSAVINVWQLVTDSGQGLFNWVSQYGKYVGYGAGFATIWLTRKRPLLESLLVTILVMDTAVPNLGLQSLCWILPIGLLAGRFNALGWFVMGALIHMFISYWGIHLADWMYRLFVPTTGNAIVQLSSLTVWLVMVWWWVQEANVHVKRLPNVFFPQKSGSLDSGHS
ncbi:MAG: hypothetical protein IPM53_16600 [Anaerolineaceae bacterium]|nr:hypothetical protein [Anaerolineaceae bacterium]